MATAASRGEHSQPGDARRVHRRRCRASSARFGACVATDQKTGNRLYTTSLSGATRSKSGGLTLIPARTRRISRFVRLAGPVERYRGLQCCTALLRWWVACASSCWGLWKAPDTEARRNAIGLSSLS
jgi:hypothetical protein